MEIDERIRQGVEFLDQDSPGWEEVISLVGLHLSSCYNCILGQVYGYYAEGVRRLDALELDPVECGFDCGITEDTSYRELQQVWKDYIRERRLAQTT